MAKQTAKIAKQQAKAAAREAKAMAKEAKRQAKADAKAEAKLLAGGKLIPSALSLKLPTGWKKQIKIREQGATAGQRDTYFIDPEGKRYRSVVEVKRALGMRGQKKGGNSRRSSSTSSSTSSTSSTTSTTSTKNKKKLKIPGQLSKYMLKKISEQKETEKLLKREAVKGTYNMFFDSTAAVVVAVVVAVVDVGVAVVDVGVGGGGVFVGAGAVAHCSSL